MTTHTQPGLHRVARTHIAPLRLHIYEVMTRSDEAGAVYSTFWLSRVGLPNRQLEITVARGEVKIKQRTLEESGAFPVTAWTPWRQATMTIEDCQALDWMRT